MSQKVKKELRDSVIMPKLKYGNDLCMCSKEVRYTRETYKRAKTDSVSNMEAYECFG